VSVWYAVNKTTADERVSTSTANRTDRAADTPVAKAPETSSAFEIIDPGPLQPKNVTFKDPDSIQTRKQEPRPKYYESLPTGTAFCGTPETTGKGALEIDNGTTEDAALRLYDESTGEITRCAFVKAHDSIRLTDIPEGTYGLKYTTGLDWKADAQTFRWLPSYDRFDRRFVYFEERIGDEIQYHEIKVTLHRVIGGNLRTVSITRDEFLRSE
jgi:hypothetical protein